MGRHSEEVNISKSQCIVHSFYFLLEAAQVCMVPFLALFLRHLGLNALQTGAVCALKALTWSLMAPFWTRTSGNCGMKKSIFLLSIFMYAATYLLVTLVPPADKNLFIDHCHGNKSGVGNESLSYITSGAMDFLPTPPAIANDSHSDGIVSETQSNTTPAMVGSYPATFLSTMSTTLLPKMRSTKMQDHLPSLSVTTSDVTTTSVNDSTTTRGRDDILIMMDKLMNYYTLSAEQLSKMSTEDLKLLIQGMTDDSESKETNKNDENNNEIPSSIRSKRYLSDEMRRSISDTIEVLRSHVFALVTVIILIGESVSSPLSYLADNLWFWFLEGIDASEHYGHHMICTLIASALFSMVITTVVDHTSCILMFDIDHFMIHFYVFAAILVLVFLLGLCFPSPTRNSKPQKKKRLTYKALCLVVKDRHHVMCLITVFLLGSFKAGVSNYLFWVVEDFDSSEMTYGFVICISSLSSIPLLILRKSLVKTLGAMGIISLSIFTCAVQMIYYSFLWSYWAVLPIQMLTGLVQTGLWIGIRSVSSFHTTSPAVDREVQLILENVHHGIGFCVGSLISGWVAETFGFSILYQCLSISSLVWGLVFVAVWKLRKGNDRSIIRYSKLNLAGDEDEGVSDHGFDEDDWLEVALKDDP